MGTGAEFAKKLGIAGAIFVLILGVVSTAMLFFSRGSTVEGYEKPESDKYYAQHLPELEREIEENLLPKAGAPQVTVELTGDKILISGEKTQLRTARLAIIHYFDEDLFEFTEVPE